MVSPCFLKDIMNTIIRAVKNKTVSKGLETILVPDKYKDLNIIFLRSRRKTAVYMVRVYM